MHKLTKESLDTLARWNLDSVRADPYLLALQAALPKREDTGIYGALGTNFGILALSIYEAPDVGSAAPFLRAVRSAGFERVEGPVEYPDEQAVRWEYKACPEMDEDIILNITLRLKQGENASCRYVSVGEKTVPDMRLLCGEALAEWEAENE